MTEKELNSYENSLQIFELYVGVSFNVKPGFVHRVVAVSDLEFIEVSTSELDDIIRLQDDLGRSHGKILSEHN
jgi:mannose-6-phosphate isomerase-like protein (cupin superfamily)